MHLYIGGKYQGMLELAMKEHQVNENQILVIDAATADLAKVEACLDDYAIVVAQEVGCGVISMDSQVRKQREEMGKVLCKLTERADQVTRVMCGLGMKLK